MVKHLYNRKNEMTGNTYPFSDDLLDIQAEVLNDARLTEQAKRFFCSVACDDGLRTGWGIGHADWTTDDVDNIKALAELGYLRHKPETNGSGVIFLPERVLPSAKADS